MYKEQPFNLINIQIARFDASEWQIIRHIFTKYLKNKIFYRRIFPSVNGQKLLRNLERNLNIRTCILYFYANPLYNHSFDRNTILSVFNKLKHQEQIIINILQQEDVRIICRRYNEMLPIFLLEEKHDSTSASIDLKLLYQRILYEESIIKKATILITLRKIYTLQGFILRLPIIYILRKFKFRNKTKRLIRNIESINTLWKSLNILSFQLNFFVFKKGIREIIKGETEIVDLSVLVMLIGDDFIDQIARNKGYEKIFNLISQKREAFEIKINVDYTLQSNDLVSLYKSLHIENVKVNDFADLTFEEYYFVMIEIFSEINSRLLKINLIKRKTTCEAISGFLNYCLSTYMDDLLFSTSRSDKRNSLKYTNWYFYKKNNCVMMYGLWLRAQLMDLDYEKFLPQIKEWGSLVENIQIYDDLKDMKADWNYQPNYPVILSFEYFYDEHLWFEQNQHLFTDGCKNDEIFELSIAMPKTVAHTMLISKLSGITNLGWFTKFAANYCWKQNWHKAFLPFGEHKFIHTKDLANHRVFIGSEKRFGSGSKAVNIVFHLLIKTQSLFNMLENKDFYFDYLLLLCLHDRNFSRAFYLKINIIHIYRIVFRFQFLKTGYKTQLLNRVMKKQSKSIKSALNQCYENRTTVDEMLTEQLSTYIKLNWI